MSFSIGDHRQCATCGQYGWFGGSDYAMNHRCPPQWNVWDESEADEGNLEEFRLVYGATEEHAAESYAHDCSDDGPWSGKVFVGEWPVPEDPADRKPAKEFCIEGYAQIAFNITEV